MTTPKVLYAAWRRSALARPCGRVGSSLTRTAGLRVRLRSPLLAFAVAVLATATFADEEAEATEDAAAKEQAEERPPGRFTMTVDRRERDPEEVKEEEDKKKDRRGVNEKFGGFNKVVFEGKKEEKLDIGRELKWEYTTTFQPKMFQPECQADLSISYTQMYDKVRVDTTIRQDGCPASSGEYRIRMRTRAEDGAVNNHEFHESWSREEPGTLEFRKDYPMGADPDLIWARIQTSHNSNCRCAPVAMEESVPGESGTPPSASTP